MTKCPHLPDREITKANIDMGHVLLSTLYCINSVMLTAAPQ